MKLWLKKHIRVPVLVLVFALAVLAVGYYETQTRGTPRSARIRAEDISFAYECSVSVYAPESDVKYRKADDEDKTVSMTYEHELFPLVLEAAEIAARARPLLHTSGAMRFFGGMRYYSLSTRGQGVWMTLNVREDQLSQERGILTASREQVDAYGSRRPSWGRLYVFTLPREDYVRLFEICEKLMDELPETIEYLPD